MYTTKDAKNKRNKVGPDIRFPDIHICTNNKQKLMK